MKRRYLLLELLVAIALVAICALPLISSPMHFLGAEIEALTKAELTRIADLEFASVKRQFYRKEIQWKDIGKKEDPPISIGKKEEIKVLIGTLGNHSFTKSIQMKTVGQKKGKNEEDLRLLRVDIVFAGKEKHTYTYKLFVGRHSAKVESKAV